MNPMDPKITHAIKEIEAVYAGRNESHAYHDHPNEVVDSSLCQATRHVEGHYWLAPTGHLVPCSQAPTQTYTRRPAASG